MASRDLTSAFAERRSAANLRRRSAIEPPSRMSPFGISKRTNGVSGSDDCLLMEEGASDTPSGVTNPQHILPPRWVDEVDSIHSSLAEITRFMGVLQSLHASRLGSVFGNDKDLEDKEGQIESLTRDITDQFRDAERMLKRVGTATKMAGGEEATVGANVQRSLALKLQELSVEFRKKQRKYLQDVQSQKGAGIDETNNQFGIDINTQDDAFIDSINGPTQQSLAVVDDLQEAVASRDQEIVQIATSIQELGAIFKELAVLVIDQGTILDRIDYNMEAVVEHTREGIQQLEKAEKQQKSARPMKCIMCLLSTICVLLLILILKHRH
eukprot:CAMPEP_0195517248 /NCGR_PEP_ID=MMETSP0794_2-20130614/10264_1 /TAXON_ID=515487 /ORGANISM="Stephanopyxis turris, Strain CCMP 815" /LENGTH=325 /DNA_ID=CAMNT_0040646023 /DNA_START=18 /DNA_END=995 /DNA_ORIENTATION=+